MFIKLLQRSALVLGFCVASMASAASAQLRLADTPIPLKAPAGATTAIVSLALPDGQVVSAPFDAKGEGMLPLARESLADGLYRYEITWAGNGKPRTGGMDNGRASDAAGAPSFSDTAASAGNSPHTVSGTFRVVDGHVLAPTEQPEPGSAPHTYARVPTAANNQVFAEDLIVQGSTCVGVDCATNENFGFDTIRLKENNTAINFTDTSNTGSFPGNDWTLQANDTTNGGLNRFMIQDVTGGKTPLSVLAGARSDALFIDGSSNIGFGTSTPALPLHLKWGNTPALRLEQDNSEGWGAQTWDIAANEANFFIRDVSNGSKLPFRIKPGAPTGSITIGDNGQIGFNMNGNAFPNVPIDIRRNQDAASPIAVIRLTNADGSIQGGSDRFTVDSNGNVTARGSIVQLSSRTAKDNFTPVNEQDVLARVAALKIGTWNYKTDPASDRHLGPVAEDFHQQFGLGGSDNRHIALTDMGGVALAAVQALQKEIQTRDKLIQALEQRISQLEAMQGAHPTAQR